MSEQDQAITSPPCMCGHARASHAGKGGRGLCYDCYGASDHGQHPYCAHYRAAQPSSQGVGVSTVLHQIQKELRDLRRLIEERLPDCPTPCDEDCEAACHEAHLPPWRRTHQPRTEDKSQAHATCTCGDAEIDGVPVPMPGKVCPRHDY